MKFPKRSYPAKVLLFGEHTVLLGSSAIAIPFPKYKCRWQYTSTELEFWWQDFIIYLKKECTEFLKLELLHSIYNTTPLKWNIPVGYGLGSSGAITAAIYDYCKTDFIEDLSELQFRLGLMESFFHGKSSGYDPLISFQNIGIYREGSEIIPWHSTIDRNLYYYLLDSGVPRTGKDTIQEFRMQADSSPGIHKNIVDLNNKIIKSLVSQEEGIFDHVNKLSQLQYDHMNYMIVDSVRSAWEESLDRKDLAIKICGAGGGGYYLVISQHPIPSLGSFELELIGPNEDQSQGNPNAS